MTHKPIEQHEIKRESSPSIEHQKLSESKETYNSSRLDVGSQKTDTIIFSGGMDIEPQPEDNLGQYWINSPMSWNVFNHLEYDTCV